MNTWVNYKMVKRLAWIDLDNPKQVLWIDHYLRRMGLFSVKNEINISYRATPHEFVNEFIQRLPLSEDTPYWKEKCRNLKAAWKAHEKRNNTSVMFEGTYNISKEARKELERLAKQNNCSMSNIINDLLLKAKDVEHLQHKLTHELKKTSSRKFDLNLLSTFFTENTAYQQALLIRQEALSEMEQQKKEHREQITNLKKQIQVLKQESYQL
ncbi:hypothetical protein [uncultured Aliivibrio sp.]|uniref:hypothetical protein n=1 Tax=uncultured Aliivibrio sp. TaxID=873085 RepID=UPI0026116CE2|nr:hypothetical protein [uncultured Aliivibrio sp.]